MFPENAVCHAADGLGGDVCSLYVAKKRFLVCEVHTSLRPYAVSGMKFIFPNPRSSILEGVCTIDLILPKRCLMVLHKLNG
jgi:hypothetical protein